MVWTPETSCGHETSKIRYLAWQYVRGTGIDVGCGQDKLHPMSIGIDTGMLGSHPVANLKHDGTKLPMFADNSLDYVYSSHFLEHCEDYKAVLKEWWSKVKVGGDLILYLPHKGLYPNIGQPGANPEHKHDFFPPDIVQAMNVVAAEAGNGFDVREDEDRSLYDEYSFFQVYRKTNKPEERLYNPWSKRKPAKSCMIIRYGAFGDMLQMLSLVEPLRKEGYTISLNTGKRGYPLVQADTRFAEIFLSDVEGPITIGFLEPFWKEFEKRYDRVINLTSSVEDLLIPSHMMPILHRLPYDMRQKMCNHNYRDAMHSIAGIPKGDPPRLTLSNEDIADAIEEMAQHVDEKSKKKPTVVLYVVRGSAHHKQYKYAAPMLSGLLKEGWIIYCIADPEAKDFTSRMIEAICMYGHDKNKIRNACGWGIGKTIAFAKLCDIVIGPETGVLNAVAYDNIMKVLMLSHSSVENLCKDWVNTCAIAPDPKEVPCYPCHRMHYDTSHCNIDTDGAAICTKSNPVQLAATVVAEYGKMEAIKLAKAAKQAQMGQLL